jgi:hypothetical protein
MKQLWGLILLLVVLSSCKQENKETELIENDTTNKVTIDSQKADKITVLDVPEVYQGKLQLSGDKYKIISNAIVENTMNKDYGNLDTLRSLFPNTFTASAKLVTDAGPNSKDSIITLKSKRTTLDFRKEGSMQPVLLTGELRDESFLLANGIYPGQSKKEVMNLFGIKEIPQQDEIEVISTNTVKKLKLKFKKDELEVIQLISQ